MALGVTKHGVASTAKGEKAHGSGNSDIDADHARFDQVLEFPCRCTAGGIDTGSIGIVPSVDEFDDIVKIFGAHDTHHRTEDFFAGDGHVWCYVIKDGGADKKAIRVSLNLKVTTVEQEFCTFLDTFFDIAQDPLFVGGTYDRTHEGLFVQTVAHFYVL